MIAGLAGIVRDVGLAEDLAQEALVVALESWGETGIPENPGAWLMATAKNRAVDRLRRDRRLAAKYAELGHEIEMRQRLNEPGPDIAAADEIADDVLRLIFTVCHPVLSQEARVALTLRMVGGLTTDEIARGFLVPKATLAQRIVRAKRTLAEAAVPFEVPSGEELAPRLGSVLAVIYLIFNEGYAATAGEDWTRPALCEEALRLGRILTRLAPGEAEAHGLLALMELQASRLAARRGRDGEAVLLEDQDRARWDQAQIRRGLAALEEAMRLAAAGHPVGSYTVQAAIAACHARSRGPEDVDWAEIAALYDRLSQISRSPVVELNRAVAISRARGAEEGLALIDRLVEAGQLGEYYLLPAVRGDLLEKLGRREEARAEFTRAAALTRNAREREILLSRAGAGRTESPDGPG